MMRGWDVHVAHKTHANTRVHWHLAVSSLATGMSVHLAEAYAACVSASAV